MLPFPIQLTLFPYVHTDQLTPADSESFVRVSISTPGLHYRKIPLPIATDPFNGRGQGRGATGQCADLPFLRRAFQVNSRVNHRTPLVVAMQSISPPQKDHLNWAPAEYRSFPPSGFHAVAERLRVFESSMVTSGPMLNW